MSALGFGVSPFGVAPFGGAFYATPTTPGAVTAAKARVVGVNGDYEVASNGNLRDAADPVDEEAYWRIATVAGSFAGDLSIGNGATRVLVTSDTSVIAIRDAVTRALEPMRARGALSSISVTADQSTTAGTTRATYAVAYVKTGAR